MLRILRADQTVPQFRIPFRVPVVPDPRTRTKCDFIVTLRPELLEHPPTVVIVV